MCFVKNYVEFAEAEEVASAENQDPEFFKEKTQEDRELNSWSEGNIHPG
jgi:hypothetical protein